MWSESYVTFGFTKVTRNGRDCVQCLHCSVVMSNASLRPSNQKSHHDEKHPQKKDHDIYALFVKRVRYDLKARLPHLEFTVEEKPSLRSSYEVAYRIAKREKPHAIAENLIKPCAEKMVEIMIGSGAKKKIHQVCSLIIPFADGLTTWLLMCASKFAPKPSKTRSRLVFNWTSLPIVL